MEHKYILIRSKRRTMSLEISKDLKITVRAPLHLSVKIIEQFVKSHDKWIEKHLKITEQHNEHLAANALSDEQIAQMISAAKRFIPQKVEHYSKIMGLIPSGVKITSAQKRFGSCSGKNSLCFSYKLMMYPEEAVDYVVVHELAHIKHHNHSNLFYSLIEKYMPDYKARAAMLKNI